MIIREHLEVHGNIREMSQMRLYQNLSTSNLK